MSRSGRNHRWTHDRQKNKKKAEKRRAQAQRHLHVVDHDDQPTVHRPPGYVSPYASERRKQEQSQKQGKKKYGYQQRPRATAASINAIADQLFGGTYYCVGDRRKNSA